MRPVPLALAAMLALLAWLHFGVLELRTDSDDALFAAALDQASPWQFLQMRFLNWSGRVPMDGIAAFVLRHAWLWRLANIGMLVLLCASIARLGFGTSLRPAAAIPIVFALWLLLPPAVLLDAAWWATGSINYLWPTALGAFALLALFDRRARSTPLRVAMLLAAGCAAYSEQVAFVLLAVGAPRLVLLWRERRADAWDAAWLAVVLVDAAINVAAPGAHVRYASEIARWYPDFEGLGLIDKVDIGLRLVASTLADADNLVVPLWVGGVAWLLTRGASVGGAVVEGAVHRVLLGGVLFLFLASATTVALPPYAPIVRKLVVEAGQPTVAPGTHAIVLLAVTLFAGVCGVLATGTALARRAPREAAWLAWAVAVGLASVAALGFSPTAYASGERIRFVCGVVLLVVTCRVFVHVRAMTGDGALRVLLVPVAGLALLRLLATTG